MSQFPSMRRSLSTFLAGAVIGAWLTTLFYDHH